MKKILYGLLSITLAAALIITVGVGSSWFTNWQIKTWFNSWGQQKPLPDNDNSDNTKGALVDVTEENGIKLMTAQIDSADFEGNGVSPAAEFAYTLTAIVNEGALDKSVIWGVSWVNPSSAWADGKSVADYATISPTTPNGLIATLTVKQAFGEQINVKVASYLDMSVNATCTVDYLKKMTSFTATLNPSLAEDKTGRLYVKDIENTISINPVYGIGTVAGTVAACKTTFTVHNTTKTRINTLMANGNGTSGLFCVSKIVVNGLTFKIPFVSVAGEAGIISGGGNVGGAQMLLNNYIFDSGASDTSTSMGSDCCLSSIMYEITYGYGNDYTENLTWTDSTGVYFNKKGLSAISLIDNIVIDKNEIVVVPSR